MLAQSMKRTAILSSPFPLQARFFGVLPKLPKLELTMRTPYKTFFKDFNAFTRLYCITQKG